MLLVESITHSCAEAYSPNLIEKHGIEAPVVSWFEANVEVGNQFLFHANTDTQLQVIILGRRYIDRYIFE